MKSLAYFFSVLIAALFLTSCNGGQSLQEYFVENSEDKDFLVIDVPASLLNLSEVDLNEGQKEAYESIKKMNILAFRVQEDNKADYEAEKTKIKEILKNPKYQDLMKFNSGTAKATVKYLGKEDAIDEVIVYGSDNQYGFAVVRVLGNKMKPENIVALVQALDKANVDGEGLNEIKGFLGM
ncbi:DUF4252 domain-containing protein [Leptobacterium sp. I13]|uniref:DUF4252 domain-containing protein n=1 Tax=Leptobacterium meishanense TaxID=3128904 RepID=UPI0030EE4475